MLGLNQVTSRIRVEEKVCITSLRPLQLRAESVNGYRHCLDRHWCKGLFGSRLRAEVQHAPDGPREVQKIPWN